MTPEQEQQFKVLVEQVGDLKAMVGKMDEFFFSEFMLDQPTRAKQIDKVLSVSRGTIFSGRLAMFFFGALLTIGSVIAAWDVMAASIAKRMGGG